MIQQSPHWAYTLRKPCSHYFQGTESVPVYISMPLCTLVGFPHGSAGKESTRNEGDLSSIPGLGRSTGEEKGYPLQYSWASLVAQMVKNPPAMWEFWVQSLDWENPLGEGMATYSSILS